MTGWHPSRGGAPQPCCAILRGMDKFKPELILLSAGFDSREGDPLGRFLLTDANFAVLTKLMMEMADKHAGGKLVSLLEGGYNLNGVGLAVASHLSALAS